MQRFCQDLRVNEEQNTQNNLLQNNLIYKDADSDLSDLETNDRTSKSESYHSIPSKDEMGDSISNTHPKIVWTSDEEGGELLDNLKPIKLGK